MLQCSSQMEKWKGYKVRVFLSIFMTVCVSIKQTNSFYISTMFQVSDKQFVEIMKNANGTSQLAALYAVGTASMLTQDNKKKNACTPLIKIRIFCNRCVLLLIVALGYIQQKCKMWEISCLGFGSGHWWGEMSKCICFKVQELKKRPKHLGMLLWHLSVLLYVQEVYDNCISFKQNTNYRQFCQLSDFVVRLGHLLGLRELTWFSQQPIADHYHSHTTKELSLLFQINNYCSPLFPTTNHWSLFSTTTKLWFLMFPTTSF